jgi:uncharacterized protein (DUF302 family)
MDADGRLNYGSPANPYSEARTLRSHREVEDCAAFLKDEIAQRDLWIVGELNPQTLASKAGITTRPARQLLFFHPRYLKIILEANPAALFEIPLKVAIFQDAQGTTRVRFSDVDELFRNYPELTGLKTELSSLVFDLSRTLAATSGP